MITEYDSHTLNYFWKEGGDVKRWIGWEDFKKRNPNEAFMIEIRLTNIETANNNLTEYLETLGE